MPKYTDPTTGKTISSSTPLSPDELEEAFGMVGGEEKKQKGSIPKKDDIGTITNAPPYWMREYVKPVVEAIPMAGGAAIAAGSSILTGPQQLAASIPLVGAGLDIGRKAYRGLERALYGTEEPRREPPSAGEAIRNIQEGMLIEETAQVGGAALSGLIKRLQPYGRKLFQETPGLGRVLKPEIKEQIKTFEKYGIDYTYADIVPDSVLPSKFEKMLEYFPGGSDVSFRKQIGKVQRLNEIRNQMVQKHGDPTDVADIGRAIKQEVQAIVERHKDVKNSQLNSLLDDFATTFGVTSKHEAGARFDTILAGTKQKMDVVEKNRWNAVTESLPEKGKDIIPEETIQGTAQKLLNEEMSLKPGERDKSIISRLKSYLPKESELPPELEGAGSLRLNPEIQELIEEGVEPTSWYGLQRTRSRLQERNRDIFSSTKRWDTREQSINNQLIDAIDQDMSAYAQSVGSDAFNLYEKARVTTRRIHDLFNKDILKIMDKSPEDVVRSIIKSGDRGTTLLRTIKAISGEEGIIPLRQSFFNELVNVSQKEGIVNGKAIKSQMNKIGMETVNELLTPDQVTFLNNLSDKAIKFNLQMGRLSKMKTIEFLNALSSRRDSTVVNMMLEPGNDEYAYLANKLLTPERLSEIKRVAMEKAMVLSGTGNLLPISSMKQLKPGEGRGLEVPLAKLFKEDYKEIAKFIEMGRNMQRVEQLAKNTSLTAPSWETLRTARGLVRHPIKTTIGLVTENTLARIYFNKSARNFMLKAWDLGPTSKAGIESFARAIQIIRSQEEPKEVGERGVSLQP